MTSGAASVSVGCPPEKRMLAKARQILILELALAERVEEDKAEVLLDEVSFLTSPAPPRRTGIGIDVHRLAPGRPMNVACCCSMTKTVPTVILMVTSSPMQPVMRC